jgi:hypothetical protein
MPILHRCPPSLPLLGGPDDARAMPSGGFTLPGATA